MAKDKSKQLGPTATYHDLGGEAPVVTILGVTFEDGEAVDLVEELGEGKAQPILAKLAGNHFFDVEGSDADHGDIRDQVASTSTAPRRKSAKAPAKVKRSVARRIEKEDAEDETVGGEKQPKADDAEESTEELPEDVKTPDAPTLESNSRPRLPRARR